MYSHHQFPADVRKILNENSKTLCKDYLHMILEEWALETKKIIYVPHMHTKDFKLLDKTPSYEEILKILNATSIRVVMLPRKRCFIHGLKFTQEFESNWRSRFDHYFAGELYNHATETWDDDGTVYQNLSYKELEYTKVRGDIIICSQSEVEDIKNMILDRLPDE